MKRLTRTLLCVVLLATASVFAQLVPVGSEFQVNTYTTGNQTSPGIAMDTDGDFTIVWVSDGQDGDGGGVFGQSFAADGSKVGSEFEVNTRKVHNQVSPVVSFGANGEFVVVWVSDSSMGSEWGTEIIGRRFSSNGLPVAADFLIQASGGQYSGNYGPNLAGDGAGNYVVMWRYSDAMGGYNAGERFQSDGTLLGAVTTPGCSGTWISCWTPSVATDPSGDYVVAWTYSDLNTTPFEDVRVQRHTAAGVATGNSIVVTSSTVTEYKSTDVARDAAGNFVVVWETEIPTREDPNGHGIQARLYAADGTPLSDAFQVNTHTAGDQRSPEVAMAADGSFVVAWYSYESPAENDPGAGIVARSFTSTGIGIGNDFQVNTTTAGDQWGPSIAMSPDGDVVITWYSAASTGSDSSGYSVQAQRYEIDPWLTRGWWAGDGNADDSTAYGNHGSIIGPMGFVPGICGSAFDMDGLETHVAVPHNSALDVGTGDFALSFWIQSHSNSGVYSVLDKRSAGPDAGYHVFLWDGGIGLQLMDGSGHTNAQGTSPVADGRLHFVTISVDRDSPTGGTIYVDGELDETFDPTPRAGSLNNTEDFRIARRSDAYGGDGFFDGVIDEVKLYGKALSVADVASLSRPECVIFWDDLESGNASAWTSFNP